MIKMHITYSESFAGIGAWGKAMHRVLKKHGDTGELKWYAEIEEKASNSFAAVQQVSEELNIWDITRLNDKVVPVDIFFYSPPCQTFSIAGKREMTTVDKGNLFWNALEKLKICRPKYTIMENVKGLTSGEAKKDFYNMLKSLELAGYHNDWKVLNSKDYGIPQNRERVFVVSIRQDLYDQGKRFHFPQPFKLTKSLKYVLEKDVPEKYYLSQKMIEGFIKKSSENQLGYINQDTQASKVHNTNKSAPALNAGTHGYANGYIVDQVKQIGNISKSDSFNGNPQTGRIYDPCGISPTLSTMQGGGQEPKIAIVTSRGRDVDNSTKQQLEVNKEGISNTITSVQKDNYVVKIGNYNGMTIRKLTPLECWRLQGFDDDDYYRAVESYDKTYGTNKDGSTKSDTQMYMRAGNSITVNVIEEILENLLYDRQQEGQQISLF